MSGKEKSEIGTTVIFHEELNEQSVTNLINELDNIDEHIYLYFTSPGGSIIYYRPLIDYLNRRSSDITLIANWEISSGAVIVFCQFEGEKYTTPNTTAMIHLTTVSTDERDRLNPDSKTNLVVNKICLIWREEIQFFKDRGLSTDHLVDFQVGKDVHLTNAELMGLAYE